MKKIKNAWLQISMCVRRKCEKCSYKDLPGKCTAIALKSMNILGDACLPKEKPAKTFPQKEHDTLCWDCKKNAGRCSWSKNFTPIKGWKAIPTKIKSDAKETDSYDVYECPEFELIERLKQ